MVDPDKQKYLCPCIKGLCHLIRLCKGKDKGKILFEQATKAQRGNRYIALLFL